MKVTTLMEIIGADFYTGVPDSQLKALCNQLMAVWGTDPKHHLIAANEGNCAAIASGYYLATGRVPAIYLQNSGEGNLINPLASLMHERVYGIPAVLIVGWRGEPGVHDEPQHVYQGEVTLRLLEDLQVPFCVIGPETADAEVRAAMERFRPLLAAGRDVAFVIRKGALTDAPEVKYANAWPLLREEILRHVLRFSGEDPIVSTTGKASRELFELREAAGQGHERDFLTVGSMGHGSSIALGVALQRPERRVWCVDGDGAALMHMGALAVIGSCAPENLIHVVINNAAHESVGGLPTAAGRIDLAGVARACGYPFAVCVETAEELDRALAEATGRRALCLIEARCAIGSRPDLGRPTTTPRENRDRFMAHLQGDKEK